MNTDIEIFCLSNNLESIVKKIEKRFNLKFHMRESSYVGLYFACYNCSYMKNNVIDDSGLYFASKIKIDDNPHLSDADNKVKEYNVRIIIEKADDKYIVKDFFNYLNEAKKAYITEKFYREEGDKIIDINVDIIEKHYSYENNVMKLLYLQKVKQIKRNFYSTVYVEYYKDCKGEKIDNSYEILYRDAGDIDGEDKLIEKIKKEYVYINDEKKLHRIIKYSRTKKTKYEGKYLLEEASVEEFKV